LCRERLGGPASIQGVVKDAKESRLKGAMFESSRKDGKQLFKPSKPTRQGRYISQVCNQAFTAFR
jgi:hypothetical protein